MNCASQGISLTAASQEIFVAPQETYYNEMQVPKCGNYIFIVFLLYRYLAVKNYTQQGGENQHLENL